MLTRASSSLCSLLSDARSVVPGLSRSSAASLLPSSSRTSRAISAAAIHVFDNQHCASLAASLLLCAAVRCEYGGGRTLGPAAPTGPGFARLLMNTVLFFCCSLPLCFGGG
jgi:hypothetical protein